MTSSHVPKGSAVARYALEGLPEKAFGVEWKIALPGEESGRRNRTSPNAAV